MKSLVAVVGAVVVLSASSTAFAGWPYVVPIVPVPPPPAVVHAFYPVGPVYAYPPPVVPVVPVVPRVVYRAPAFYPPVVVAPAPVVIRSKVYVWGQPVRNAIRAVLP